MTEYQDHWITTYTGKRFHYLKPSPDEIDIVDIAHHLSLLCRFTGACRVFYCISPNTKVLTAGLIWEEAGNLILNQPIIAFEEYPRGRLPDGSIQRRKIKKTVITSLGTKRLPSYKIIVSDGTEMVVSEEHKFLTHLGRSRRNIGWRTAQELYNRFTLKDGRKSPNLLLPKYFNVWETDDSYKGGFIAASFDGEGHIHTSAGGLGVFYSQKTNPMFHTVCQYLTEFNIPFRVHSDSKGMNVVAITGGYQFNLGFLGKFRPPRLLNNWKNGEQLNFEASKIGTFPITSIEAIGKKEVVTLGTSTHTLFTEGFASHNSVGEHSLRVCDLLPDELKLAGLLHDAAEAYINDISRPVKHTHKLQKTEKIISDAIANKFDIDLEHPDIKEADNIMIATEARDLMPNIFGWARLPKPLKQPVIPICPEAVETLFLLRFRQLGGYNRTGELR